MATSRDGRRQAANRHRHRAALRRAHAVEQLERRDCPAAIAVSGPTSIDENGAPAQIVVSLSEPVSKPVTVSFSLRSAPATATLGRDYRLQSGTRQLPQTGLLTFRPGQTSQTLTVRPLNDLAREGNETFTFTLQQPRNASLSPTAGNLPMTIRDDDAYTATLVGPAKIVAGQAAEYTLQLSSPATRREAFLISTLDDTAVVTQDYRPLSRLPVVILPGQTTARVRVVTLADPVPAYDKAFFVTVEPLTRGFPAPAPFPITIEGPLGPRPPTIDIADLLVAEGAAGETVTAMFVVSLSFPSTAEVSIDYSTVDDTASVGNSDYVPATGTLTFAPGETSKTIEVTVVGDDVAERDEVFGLALSNPVRGLLGRAAAVATIENDDGDPAVAFQIDVIFPDDSFSVEERVYFLEAAARWSEIIVGDLPDMSLDGRLIDDIEILATAGLDDGPGGFLGAAGPTEFRPDSELPFQGEMIFDIDDVPLMIADDSFAAVIIHEMAHALGFGTLWETLGLVEGIGTADPIYVGANALREYTALAGPGPTSIPVEDTGDPGTYGGHWRESVFVDELMTGYLDPGFNPISAMTIGSLEDLGYQVDYAAADLYTIPMGLRRQPASASVATSRPAAQAAVASSRFLTAALLNAAADAVGSGSAHGAIPSRVFRSLARQG